MVCCVVLCGAVQCCVVLCDAEWCCVVLCCVTLTLPPSPSLFHSLSKVKANVAAEHRMAMQVREEGGRETRGENIMFTLSWVCCMSRVLSRVLTRVL